MMVTLEWFAESYGWTEEQTRRENSLEALEWFPLIKAARIKATETRHSQTARVDQATYDAHNAPRQLPFSQGMRSPGSG